MNTVKLNNGIEMPRMGYGAYWALEDACKEGKPELSA